VLPELPVPGPSSSSIASGSSLLYHQGLVNEATQLLSSQNDALSGQVAALMSNTSVDYVDLASTSASASPLSLPQSQLVGAVYQKNPALFAHVAQHWNKQQSQTQNNYADRTTNNYANQSSGASQGAPSYDRQGQNQQAQYGQRGNDNATAVESHPAAAQNDQSGREVIKPALLPRPRETVPKAEEVTEQKPETNKPAKSNHSIPMIKLNKLSKEAEELMKKSVNQYKMQNADVVKAEQMGVYDNFTPRSRRARYVATSEDGVDGEASEDDEDDLEEDSVEGKKSGGRNKFFKASEKERDEEKKRLRDVRKRRAAQDHDGGEDFVIKRRKREPSPPPEPPKPFVPKKVTRTLARNLVPMIPKINMGDEEDNTFQRFNKAVEVIFDNMEEINPQELEKMDDGAEIPPEFLIPRYQLTDLTAETAKLKSLGVMESISAEKLVKLLNILELNIRDGSKVTPLVADDDDEENDSHLWLDMAQERVMRAADASLTVLYVLTSKNMSKKVFIDDVIDRVAIFLRFQLSNTIYPSYDPVYKEMRKSKTGYVGSMKKKRSYAQGTRDRNVLNLYNKTHELVSLMADLVKRQLMTDTTILHISSLGVTPFFVESVPELQLASLKLVTSLFSKYEKHRKLLLDDILASIARLPSSKRSLRSYRLNSTTHIQMLTALVLQLIQCVVILPRRLANPDAQQSQQQQRPKKGEEEVDLDGSDELDRDVLVNEKYKMAMATAHQFLTVFLKKCGSKNEDVDYRPLFENFVQDLLTTVNVPEWPAAELLLTMLGHVLRQQFTDRSTEMALRISSLEYLGVVAARLRKDAVQSRLKEDHIDSIVKIVKEEEEKESVEEGEEMAAAKKKRKNDFKDDPEEERNVFLQRVLLDFLAVNGGEDDQAVLNARHFYICQWYRDVIAIGRRPKAPKTPKKHKNKKRAAGASGRRGRAGETSSEDESSEEEEEDPEEDLSDAKKSELYHLKERRKDLLMVKISPFGLSRGRKAQVLSTHIDHESAHLIVKYLSSKRPFFNSFNSYLKDILKVLTEQSTHIRTKALKCMTMIVTEDPDVLLRDNMRQGVSYSFMDPSTMVREAAVDLVGKFILHKQDLIDQYYDVITTRILDTGVSVRKRVIKILKDICLEYPSYGKIPEMCVKMIRRINDEEGIRKLVMEVFQNMWFNPMRERNRTPDEEEHLVTRAQNITDVVVACRDTGLEWFEQLLQTLFRPREDKEDATKKNCEPPPHLLLACQQIVDCLTASVLRIEEESIRNANNVNGVSASSSGSHNKSMGSSNRIVACVTSLYLFAKIRPQLLVPHVQTLQPYLQIQCQTAGDFQIISCVARTLELAVPLIKHPSEIFLSQLEEDAVKLIMKHDKKVISACVSCLGSIVNSVTKNFKLIRDCFGQYYHNMERYRQAYEANPKDPRLYDGNMSKFRRAMFTVSLLLRYFDFSQAELYTELKSGAETVEEVFETTFFFMLHEQQPVQSESLAALGAICIRHYNFMLETKLKQLYLDILTEDFYPVQHKIRVLQNLELYLSEEEIRMRRLDEHWSEYADKEKLKEMNDVSSGMASNVIQVYLKAVLDSFIHPEKVARHAALKVIQLILSQGLVNPILIVPYLICMSTDAQSVVAHTADRELQEIEKKYPGFIISNLLQGMKLSHRLQEVIKAQEHDHSAAAGNDKPIIVRGFRQGKDGEAPAALNGFLYSIMKTTKSQRRAILTKLLKQFDDTAVRK